VKWDGYRLSVLIEPTRIRILTRAGHDWMSYKRRDAIAETCAH
jgi:ATP-dependent DNA ligase